MFKGSTRLVFCTLAVILFSHGVIWAQGNEANSNAVRLIQSGQRAEAIQVLLATIEQGRANPTTYLMAGQLLGQRQDFNSGLQVLQKGAAQFPSNADIAAMLGNTNMALGRFDQGVHFYEKAVNLSANKPDYVQRLAQAHYLKGMDAYTSKDYFTALASAKAASRLDAANAQYHHLQGVASFVLGQNTDANAALERATELESGNGTYFYDLALVKLKQGKTDAAERALLKSIDLEPAPMAYLYLGQIRHNQSHIESALETFRKALALDPQLLGVNFHIGFAYKGKGDDLKAIGEMEKEVQLHPEFLPARLELGDSYLRIGDGETALVHLAKATQLAPGDARGHYLHGKAFFSLGKNREALSSLQKAVQVDPTMPDPEYLISQIYLKGGDVEAAQRHLELFRVKKKAKGSP